MVDYEALDPGIRWLVRLLNKHGFETTDSGDGVTKGEDGEDEPHVYMLVEDPDDMIYESHRLMQLMDDHMKPANVPFRIQATYSPHDRLSILSVHLGKP